MSEVLIELCAGTDPERWWQDGREWIRQDILFNLDGGLMPSPFKKLPGEVYDFLKTRESDSVDAYVMNHALEHFNYVEGEHDGWYTTVDEILTEISRSLKAGGTLHVEVPNIAGSAKEYLLGNISGEQFCEYLYGGSEYQWNVHYCGFVKESLERRLVKHGFEPNVVDIGLVLVADAIKK